MTVFLAHAYPLLFDRDGFDCAWRCNKRALQKAEAERPATQCSSSQASSSLLADPITQGQTKVPRSLQLTNIHDHTQGHISVSSNPYTNTQTTTNLSVSASRASILSLPGPAQNCDAQQAGSSIERRAQSSLASSNPHTNTQAKTKSSVSAPRATILSLPCPGPAQNCGAQQACSSSERRAHSSSMPRAYSPQDSVIGCKSARVLLSCIFHGKIPSINGIAVADLCTIAYSLEMRNSPEGANVLVPSMMDLFCSLLDVCHTSPACEKPVRILPLLCEDQAINLTGHIPDHPCVDFSEHRSVGAYMKRYSACTCLPHVCLSL